MKGTKSWRFIVNSILILIFAFVAIFNLDYLMKTRFFSDSKVNEHIAAFSAIVACIAVAYVFFRIRFSKSVNESNAEFYLKKFLNVSSLWLATIFLLALAVVPLLKTSELISTTGDDTVLSAYDINNFYTAFIALCTTFVVGFQIYNSVELGRRISELNNKSQELQDKFDKESKRLATENDNIKNGLIRKIDELNDKIKEQENSIAVNKYYNAYNNGTLRYCIAFQEENGNVKRYCWHCVRAYFNAIKFALYGGHEIISTIDAVYPKIKECIDVIKNENVSMPSLQLNHIITDTNNIIGEIEQFLEDNKSNENLNNRKRNSLKELFEKWDCLIETIDIDTK